MMGSTSSWMEYPCDDSQSRREPESVARSVTVSNGPMLAWWSTETPPMLPSALPPNPELALTSLEPKHPELKLFVAHLSGGAFTRVDVADSSASNQASLDSSSVAPGATGSTHPK